jgi:hypothetical protein
MFNAKPTIIKHARLWPKSLTPTNPFSGDGIEIGYIDGVIRFDYRTSEKQFQTGNHLENDDPHINPMYATGELDVEVWVVSRLKQFLQLRSVLPL